MSIYLDNAATTQVFREAADVAYKAMTETYSNPASLHSFGLEAEQLLEEGRKIIAANIGCKEEELYFTASGTSASNTAIFGSLASKKKGRIITSAFEHPAVLECFKALENRFEVIYLKPDKDGIISPESLEKELTDDTLLVSIMHVNNETGAVNPITELAQITHRVKGALFHTDAVQSFTKQPFSYSVVDMASFSAHKTHAPKGLGALYVKKGVKVKPVILGGGQEKGMFSGTSNVPGVCAWAKALELQDAKKNYGYVKELNALAREKIKELGGQIISPDNASPYILNVAFEHYIGENILHYLSSKGVYISTGSACSSKHASHVFKALGMEKYQKNALRFSFSHLNTKEEINEAMSLLAESLSKIIRK